jgi:ADP-heptose:LPS heptosyltransferase
MFVWKNSPDRGASDERSPFSRKMPEPTDPPVRRPRVLVIETHHLGDAVMALPFLRAAARRTDVRVLCAPGVGGFLSAAAPDVRVTGCASWRDVLRAVPRLGAGDAAVCAWPDTRAHWAMRRSGAEIRVGFRLTEENFYGIARPWRRRRLAAGRLAGHLLSLAGPLLTRPLDRPTDGQTHGEKWTAIARALGWEPDFSFPWLPVPAPPPEFSDFVAASRAAGMRVAALHAGGRLPGKRWPLENFEAMLSEYFPSRRVAVAIVRAPGEACPAPRAADQRVFDSPSPLALAGLLAAADGVLSNDSFAAHMAAAVGVPVVTVFGSGDPAWFAPHGNARLCVAADACPFRPCVDRCEQPRFLCIEGVSVPMVAAKLDALFGNSD